MTKSIFIFLLVVHSLIHLLGFAKSIRPHSVPQLKKEQSAFSGILWLCAAAFILSGTIIYALDIDFWWMFGFAGLLLSQTLIFQSWKDARFGTIANFILLLGVILGYGNWHFNLKVNSEVHSLLSEASNKQEIVTEEMIAPLPPVVQNWLRKTECMGKPVIQTVYLKQKGGMLLKPGTSWNEFEADQYVSVDPYAFLWKTDVLGPLGIKIKGRDVFQHGTSNMLIKLLYILPLVDESGPEIDQAAALRYLSEIIWYPTAALSNSIEWEQIDEHTAKATIHSGETAGSGIFHFNEEGLVTSFETKRYYYRKGNSSLEKWVTNIDENSFSKFDGILVPGKASITWKLSEGDFNWFRLELTDLKYNINGSSR